MKTGLKSGDSVTVTRDGKVFLSQYTNVSGFASVSRTLGSDPDGEYAAMQALVDRLWATSVLQNLALVEGATAALGDDIDIGALIVYLENLRGKEQEQPAQPARPAVRRKRLA